MTSTSDPAEDSIDDFIVATGTIQSPDDEPKIAIIFRDISEDLIEVKAGVNTSLSRIVGEFCRIRKRDLNSYHYLYKGARVSLGDDTPARLKMKDADGIDVVWWKCLP